MSNAVALHVVARVRPGQAQILERVLEDLREDPAENTALPFGRLSDVHFGRLALLPPAIASGSPPLPATLLLTTNFDGEMSDHLDEVVNVAGEGLDRIFEHCDGYPPAAARNAQTRRSYLARQHTRVNAFYVNTIGRRVRQVERDAKLCEAIGAFLDRERPRMFRARMSAAAVRDEVAAFVSSSPEHAWAMHPVDEERGRELSMPVLVLLALGALAGLVALPWLLLPLALFALVVRAHELGDVPDNYRPSNARISARELEEDHGVQNQLTAIGYLQRGLFRRVLTRAVLWALDLGSRALFYRGQLAGVETIHFARWVMLDGGRRVVFESNYDGSPESYQDDFIGIAYGLNLVFSNGRGWPRTRWLLFGGASDEQAFRAYYRDHQVRTQVWFANPAYRNLTAVNVARNERIRRGLTQRLSTEQLEAWVRML